MNTRRCKTVAQNQAGFTSTDVIALVGCLTVAFVFLFFLLSLDKKGCGAKRIPCVSNLKNIGLAARIYATDHYDKFPNFDLQTNRTDRPRLKTRDYFFLITNELSTPKIIYCPEDKERVQAQNFDRLSNYNISYFASLTADATRPEDFLAGDRNLTFKGQPVPTGFYTLTTNQQIGWSKKIHVEQGRIVMSDGSVQQFSSSRLRADFRHSGMITNLLLIP